jgi:hypothetical protein
MKLLLMRSIEVFTIYEDGEIMTEKWQHKGCRS